MTRAIRLTSIGLAAGALASIAGSAIAATVLKGTSGPLAVTFTPPPTHKPKINTNVPISVTATLKGKPAHATAAYEFLFGGMVVSTQYPRNNKHFSFTGHFSDTLVFPGSAVGEPLTLRVVIKAAGHTVKLSWSISAKR